MAKYRSRATRCGEASNTLETAKSDLENLTEAVEEIIAERDAITLARQDDGGTPEEIEAGLDPVSEDHYAGLQKQLDDAEETKSNGLSEFESLAEEMRSWEENTAEKFSQTEKYERVSEAADTMESARDTIEGIDWPVLPGAAASSEKWQEFVEACDEAASAIQEAVDEAGNAEFPGMRG